MWRPPFVLAVIDAWHMHTSWFGSLITLTNDLCLFFVCLYLDLDVDVAAAAAVAAALHVLQDTDGHEERESSALPSLRRAPPRRSSRRRVSTPAPTLPPPPRPPPSPSSSPLRPRRAPPNRQAPPRPPPRPIPVPPPLSGLTRPPPARALSSRAESSPGNTRPTEIPTMATVSDRAGDLNGDLSSRHTFSDRPRLPAYRRSGVPVVTGAGSRAAGGSSTAAADVPRPRVGASSRPPPSRASPAIRRRGLNPNSSLSGPSSSTLGGTVALTTPPAVPRRRVHLPHPSRPAASNSPTGGCAARACCQPMRRGRAHTSGRCGFDLPADPGAAARTLEAPPPPLNKMAVYGNDAIGIPPDRERFVRALVRAAVKEYFVGWHTWGHQEEEAIALAVVYVEHHEPRLAACVRSRGACALLSRAINNKAAWARCSCKAALSAADGAHGSSAGVGATGAESTRAGPPIDNVDAGSGAEVVDAAAVSTARRAPGIAGVGSGSGSGAGGGAAVPRCGGGGAAAGAGATGASAATPGARTAEEFFNLIR